MEEASEKAFDEKSVKNFVDKKDKLTKRDKFGTESGENADSSNTIDDFDGYSATITKLSVVAIG